RSAAGAMEAAAGTRSVPIRGLSLTRSSLASMATRHGRTQRPQAPTFPARLRSPQVFDTLRRRPSVRERRARHWPRGGRAAALSLDVFNRTIDNIKRAINIGGMVRQPTVRRARAKRLRKAPRGSSARGRAPRPRGETRDALIDAGIRIFGRDGYLAATTKTIASEARANQALISYYFGGKDGLYRAVVERIVEEIGARLGP